MNLFKRICIIVCLVATHAAMSMSPKKYQATYPLHAAAHRGYVQAVEPLLKKGKNIDQKDTNDETPLMIAAAHGNKDTVKLLLNKGADRDITDFNGNSAWNYADKGSKKISLNSIQQANYKAILELLNPLKREFDDTESLFTKKIKIEDERE